MALIDDISKPKRPPPTKAVSFQTSLSFSLRITRGRSRLIHQLTDDGDGRNQVDISKFFHLDRGSSIQDTTSNRILGKEEEGYEVLGSSRGNEGIKKSSIEKGKGAKCLGRKGG